jgi:CBS domain-containing protein
LLDDRVVARACVSALPRVRRRVRDILSPTVPAVAPDAPIVEVARAMRRFGVDAAVVVDGDSLVGIVTTTDVVAALAGLR